MIWMDVDAALAEVPVNVCALIDDTDFTTREESVTYDQAGMDLVWNFVTTAGAMTQTAVTPTTAGVHDWANQGNAMYSIEIPASAGTINNDTEGFGWFTGFATGVLPWCGPVIGFRAAALNNALIDGGDVLDVSLTEIGGVAQSATDLKDFADAGYDPATNKVQGVLLVDTTTTNTDMVGTDSAATAAALATAQADLDKLTGTDGATLATAQGNYAPSKAGDAMTLTAAATSAQLVDDVWDEVLTGGTHNAVNSAGRRLRQIQEAGGYSGGAVYVDTVNGTAGTTTFENGTETLPVDNIADANTLAAALGISRFQIAPGSSITLTAAQNNQSFDGTDGWTLALGGQDIAGSSFRNANVSGVSAGAGTTQKFVDCLMNNTSHIKNTHLHTCGILGTQTLIEAGDHFWDRCHSGVAGTGVPVMQWGPLVGSSNVNIRNYSGGVQFEGMGDTGTDTASVEGRGQFIEGTCAGGTVAIRGNFTVSGITNLTLSDDARIDIVQINTEVDTALSDYDGPTRTEATADKDEILVETTAIKAKTDNLPENIQKNQAFDIGFVMVLTSDGRTPATGLTVAATRSIDGAAFGAVTGSVAEISSGAYRFSASAADANGDDVTYRFTAATADDVFISVKTTT